MGSCLTSDHFTEEMEKFDEPDSEHEPITDKNTLTVIKTNSESSIQLKKHAWILLVDGYIRNAQKKILSKHQVFHTN